MLDLETLKRLPKTLIHDHLDGGLRPQTIVELAAQQGVALPTTDAQELEQWFHRGANRGNLALYLEGFGLTTAVMQDEDSLRRVARERVEDLIDDGIVYAELRFSPLLHLQKGLNLEQVVSAVVAGLNEATDNDRKCVVRVLICGMRSMAASSSLEMAELAINFRGRGVVGFDLAGDEFGHPPKHHLEAFQLLRRENFSITIHAGEAFGLASIWQAIQYCGAHRIGHATRLHEDYHPDSPSTGTLAQYILDHRVVLEMCLSSNVHTGACESLETHPFPRYFRDGFRITLNTDNVLMSATTLSREWQIASELYGLGIDDLLRLSTNGVHGSFLPYPERRAIVDRIEAGFAEARG